MQKLAAVTATTLALAVLIQWIAPTVVEYPVPTGEMFAVATTAGTAVVDLPPAESGSQYLLVVGNTSTDPTARRVTLLAEPIEQVERLPQAYVPRLEPKPLTPKIPQATTVVSRSLPLPERTFWLLVTGGESANPQSYRPIVGCLAGEGPSVRVYVDRDDRVDVRVVEAIVNLYEHSVQPTVSQHLGLPLDVDGDGVFTIFLTSWLDRLEGGRLSLGGMVRPSDFSTSLAPPFSNRADVLYLNSNVRVGAHLETLLAHELAHAVTCSGRQREAFLWSAAPSEEVWLNEAISHVVENLQSNNWSNLDYRVASYLVTPESAPLVVSDYRAAGLGRDPAARGSTYLFLRWCVDHYGPGLLSRLIYSRRSGIDNLEYVTGEPFDELYRRFSVDLFLASARHEAQSEAPSHGSIARVDLGRPLENWGLAGPRYDMWDLQGGQSLERQVSLKGTTSRHFVVVASPDGARRIRVESEPGCELQVTLVRLPDATPRLQLQVVDASDGGWRLLVRETGGKRVHLTHAAWQAVAQADNRGSRPAHQLLKSDRLSELFDAVEVAPHGKLLGQPVSFTGMPRGPVTVWVAGIDEDGRRTAGWTTLDLSASQMQLARWQR